MNKDSYNEIINGEDTYKGIVDEFIQSGKCIIGWTDGEYGHRDILFTFKPEHLGGDLQRGLRWCVLYVSIIAHGCMGFVIEGDGDNTKDNEYLREKLNLYNNHCDDKICELINGIIKEIDSRRKNIYGTRFNK